MEFSNLTDHEYSSSASGSGIIIDKTFESSSTSINIEGSAIPIQSTLSNRWATGESISGQNVSYTSVGLNFKSSIYIEGKYCKTLVGILRLDGFNNTDGEDNNLEVVRKVFNINSTDSYNDAYTFVYTQLQNKIQEALLFGKGVENPSAYYDARDKFLAMSHNNNRKRKPSNGDSRGAKVGISTIDSVHDDLLPCRHAHRFPVQRGGHFDHELIGKIKCDGLHLIYIEDDNSNEGKYELCDKECCRKNTHNDSLFSHIKNIGVLDENIQDNSQNLPYCQSCQAIKESLATMK